MSLLCALLCIFGSFCVSLAVECVPETAKCSKYWQKTLPHKDLMATEEELNSWCSKQNLFFRCLEDILLDGKNGNLSYLPINLLISKLFSEDLCSENSKNRRILLDNAECINQLDTDFCTLPEYLDIVTPDEAITSTRCSQSEKTFSCIAATMVLNCGFDAARVYRTMLKITRYSDEVCGIEQSEGIPPCERELSKSTARNEKLSEIYYGLFHRIGDVLDQNEDGNESYPDDKNRAASDSILTKAVQNMIDNLDKNAVSEECDEPNCLNSQLDSECSENITEYKPYMKSPVITEVLREILFYNYSGKEFAVYWRQPEVVFMDTFNCQHFLPSFLKFHILRCRFDYRYKDPDCVSNATVHEKVTPEFIRSFDPEVPCDSVTEFGPLPDWKKELDQMYEDKRIRDQMTTTTEAPTVTGIPEVLATSSTLLHIASTTASNSQKKWYDYDLKKLNINSPIPNDIHMELLEVFKPDLKNWVPPQMNVIKIGNSLHYLLYNSEAGEKMENITCSRLNECHPKGKGLFKCKVWPRKIETCEVCGEKPTDEKKAFGIQYARPSNTFKALYATSEATEPTVTMESEILGSKFPSSESTAFVINGDKELERSQIENAVNIEPINDMESSDEGDSVNEDVQLNDIREMDFNLIPDSENEQFRFRVLTVSDENKDSGVVYAIQDSEDEDSEVILATEDSLLAGKILLIDDLSDFESKYTIVSTPDTE